MIMAEIGRGLIKGGSKKDSDRAKYVWMEVFTHFMEEVTHRGLDIRYFTSDQATWSELDGLMESRFPDFEAPTREWADEWQNQKRVDERK